MRSIREIKRDIIELEKQVNPDIWAELVKLLDEIFIAYFVKAKKHDIEILIESIGHYERHALQGTDIHLAIQDFRDLVEAENYTEAKAIYKIKEYLHSIEE